MESSQHSLQQTLKKPNTPALKVKNRLIYYAIIVDRYIFAYLGSQCFYSLSIFMDTIANKNNFNFTKEENEYYIGVFTSVFYLGSALGSILTGFLTRMDTRMVFALLRIGNGLGLVLFAYPDTRVMILARFMMGFFYDASCTINCWSMYEILLPRHRQRAVTLVYFFNGICFFSCTIAALFDDHGWLFWRLVFIVPGALLAAEVLLSLVALPNINSLTYLVKVKSQGKAIKALNYYLEEETARYMVQKFQANRITQKIDLGEALASETQTRDGLGSETQNEDGMILSQAQKNKKMNAELRKKNKQKSRKGVFWRDLRVYRVEITHVVIFTLTSMLSFHDLFYQFSVYLGAKNLSNQKAVEVTKQFLVYGSAGKIISCFVAGGLNLTRKRKLCLVLCHLVTLILLGLITYGYYIEDLTINRYCLALGPVFTVGLYSVNDIYSNDICPPSLFSINHTLVRGVSAVFGMLIPYYIHFEIYTYRKIALRLLSLIIIGAVCLLWLVVRMIETDGMEKKAIRKKLKGR